VEAAMTKAAKWMAVVSMAAILGGPAMMAETAGAVSTADQQGIQTTLDAFGSTLTKMDFDAFSTLFTDDADFVNIVGMHWHGKAQIVKAHRVVFTTRYKGVPQRIIEKSEATLAPGLVLVVGTIKMDDYTAQDGKAMTNNLFRMTLVMKKVGERWLIRSAENTVIDTVAAPHDPGK
jgi:uncharacterized protein (TIGR02246 family)